jgi:hypothetical protein
MSRRVLEVLDLARLADVAFTEPVRLAFVSPGRGGPRVPAVRAALALRGRLRLSGTALSTFADLDPGEPEAPVLALDTIVRSDAAGLERMLLSVLPHVDEVVLGVDGRSDEDTLRVAQGYADATYVFEAADIGLDDEAWKANKIDFAAARNIGRARVHSPWTLVVDSDEYVQTASDLRWHVRDVAPTVGALSARISMAGDDGAITFESHDFQRLARTKYRWISASHNQLVCDGREEEVNLTIIQDTRLRATAEQARRDAQRDVGINELVDEAAKGNLNALFHLAKHRSGVGDLAEAVRLVEDFRLRAEPNSITAFQRLWLALGIAFRYYNLGQLAEANRWACRALLDGPVIAAFCLLGDIAEDELDLERARNWYEAACAVTDFRGITWPGAMEVRWGRLAGLQLALATPENKKLALETITGGAAPDSPHDASASTDPTAGTSG